MAVGISLRCGLGWGALCQAESYGVHPGKLKALEYGLKAAYFAPVTPIIHINLGNAPVGCAISLETALEAQRLDALYLYGGAGAGLTLFWLGRPAEALPYLDEVLGIEPEMTYGLLIKSLVLYDLGRLAEAEDLLRKSEKDIQEGNMLAPWLLWAQYMLTYQGTDPKKANPLLEKILKRLNDPKTTALEIDSATYFLLAFLVRHGMMETVLQVLERDQEAGYFPFYDVLILHPGLEPLRRDPRFKPVMERSRKDFESIVRALGQARSRGELPRYLEAPFADLLKKLDIRI